MGGQGKDGRGVEFWMQGPVLRFMARGPFDLEQVRQLTDAMSSLFSEMPQELPFATVMEFKGSMVADQATLDEFERLLMDIGQWRRVPVAVGLIAAHDVEGMPGMVDSYRSIFTRQGRMFSHFADAGECQVWSAQQVALAREVREKEAALIAERVSKEAREARGRG